MDAWRLEMHRTFCLALRVADGVAVGLGLELTTAGQLRVTAIEPKSAFASWNALCDAEREVRSGYLLLGVNGECSPGGMLRSVQNEYLLRLCFAAPTGNCVALPCASRPRAARRGRAVSLAASLSPPRGVLQLSLAHALQDHYAGTEETPRCH